MRGSQASHPQGTTGDISRHSVQLRWGSSAVGFHCNRVVQQNAVTVRLITPSVVHRRTAPGAQREGDDRLAPLRLLRLLLDLPLAGPHRGQFRCACAPPPAHIPPLLPPHIPPLLPPTSRPSSRPHPAHPPAPPPTSRPSSRPHPAPPPAPHHARRLLPKLLHVHPSSTSEPPVGASVGERRRYTLSPFRMRLVFVTRVVKRHGASLVDLSFSAGRGVPCRKGPHRPNTAALTVQTANSYAEAQSEA